MLRVTKKRNGGSSQVSVCASITKPSALILSGLTRARGLKKGVKARDRDGAVARTVVIHLGNDGWRNG